MSIRKTSLLLICITCVMMFSFAINANASAGSVTGYQKITWGISTGRYYVNGIHAFCSEYNKTWPTVGTQITSIVPCEDEVVRKVLYYGYNGPANTLGTDARAHVLTAIAVSDAKIGVQATYVKEKYNEFYRSVVNNPSQYPTPPNNFKVYYAIPVSSAMQTLAFYEIEKNGYVTADKKSADSSVTEGNSNYTLEGAEYGIYAEQTLAESSRVGTLITNKEGKTNTLELAPGTYYAREIVAPKGYEKSEEVHQFTVSSEQTSFLHFQDSPKTYEIDVLLQKVDSQTGFNKPQGQATLEGARFQVKFYPALFGDEKKLEELQLEPTRTWVFKTDQEGVVRIQDSYKTKGDVLFSKFPLGTLLIQEIQASEGYSINEEVFIRQITEEGIGEICIVKEKYIDPVPIHIELPKTGSSMKIYMGVLGVALCSSYGYFTIKKKRRN